MNYMYAQNDLILCFILIYRVWSCSLIFNSCILQGFYKYGTFQFSFKVGHEYPHDAPKVKCETLVYHPNIDLEGNICLNILR